MFQAALTVHDIDADSAIWTCSTDERSSCRFSEDEEVIECVCIIIMLQLVWAAHMWELYHRNKQPLGKKYCHLCTTIQPPWCNINTGATVASGKWLGVIKKNCPGQQLFAGCTQLLSPTTLNITLDIVSVSELYIELQYRILCQKN